MIVTGIFNDARSVGCNLRYLIEKENPGMNTTASYQYLGPTRYPIKERGFEDEIYTIIRNRGILNKLFGKSEVLLHVSLRGQDTKIRTVTVCDSSLGEIVSEALKENDWKIVNFDLYKNDKKL
jgi:hypothetical protein